MYNLKVSSYVLIGDLTVDYIAQETASQIALRNCSKEGREEPGYTGLFVGKQPPPHHSPAQKKKKPMSSDIKRLLLGFPGGAVVENLPANAGDTGSSPGLGRSHMPRSN